MRLGLAFAAAVLLLAGPAAAAPADDFHRLLDEHYQWLLKESPTQATALGTRSYDDKLQDLSPAARTGRIKQAQAFLTRIDAIPASALSPADQVNRAIMRRTL